MKSGKLHEKLLFKGATGRAKETHDWKPNHARVPKK